ncbi:hypothetical protein [Brevundimonas variabilis]|uniref:Uncharacterized protein n=1 Tax=Brevundimonas variabilis TaxID=74312 RepID=A0A7W9FHD3_9CAUL|nr:hypothetical protein [Brevundimonas variabilis]MBB5747314.1 hypothetical protein [Brevundimonas variabilis]
MSSDRPDDTSAAPETETPVPARSATPFVRAPMQWGRPPQVVFQAGPLPRGQRLEPLPETPSQPPPRPVAPQVRQASAFGGSIHSGSLIPRARPSAATGPLPTSAPARPTPTPTPEAVAAPLPPRAEAPVATRAPQTPPPPPAEPAPSTRLAVEAPAFESSAPPADGVQNPPSVRARPASRTPIYAGIAAVAVIGVAAAAWFAFRPGSATTPEIPVPAASITTPPAAPAQVAASVPDVEPDPAEPNAVEAPPPASPIASGPSPSATPASNRPVAAIRTASPARTESVPSSQPQAPAIVVAPLEPVPAGPPPTVAQPSQTDPDAPILTRPQPLD